MKAVVSIGAYRFATSVQNGSKLVELLGKCDEVEWVDHCTYKPASTLIRGRIEMRLVNDREIVGPKAPKRLPEKAGPDCHGPMLPPLNTEH